MSVKLTHQQLSFLEDSKGKLIVKVVATSNPLNVESIDLIKIVGWRTEEVPAKKGIFGHGHYISLTHIEVKDFSTQGTDMISVYDASETLMARLREGRGFGAHIEACLNKFGYKQKEDS
jgi:hypothetical protein